MSFIYLWVGTPDGSPFSCALEVLQLSHLVLYSALDSLV